MIAGRRILLIVGGGIAAYKALDLIRRLRDTGASVVPVLTKGGAQFVTPLSVSALAGHKVQGVQMLGLGEKVGFTQDGRGLTIVVPEKRPCKYAYTFKITLEGR